MADCRRFVTLTWQCWLFAVGSVFFAVGTAPGFPPVMGAAVTNILCFVGSWFFTAAGLIQLILADPGVGRWSSAIQSLGTVLFNVSTGGAVWAHAVRTERTDVWAPDALGSLGFLVSGGLALLLVQAWAPRSRDWQATWINMIGCLAFAASAVGAFVRTTGVTADALLANVGTFIGALCFLAAALMILPCWSARH
ncbi:hypothetical protein [Gordonia liuliyuniae]|uniref:YrhK-like protein n=1 Tax=Gordonia liuliyuniae TaxID=2911517 RepID=A0ABS9ISW8_9ACTN|nr:hypothetical protein [Gordonia liuliyuniae]MCF8588662.1 hypothetical protein [Gordonia liuliyuniae]